MIEIEVSATHSDFFIRDMIAVIMRDTVSGRGKWAACGRSLWEDPALRDMWIDFTFDTILRAWRYPDWIAGWEIDPFPGWTRFARWLTTRTWWR